MAQISITPQNTVTREATPIVQVRQEWTGSWETCPYIVPVSAVNRVAPGVSEAEFRIHYGTILWLEETASARFRPEEFHDWFVRILLVSEDGESPIFYGVFGNERLEMHGATAHDQSGDQILVAYGLEILFDRVTLDCAYADITDLVGASEGDCAHTYEVPTFNRSGPKGLEGNRSTDVDAVTGVHYFSSDGEVWTNQNILEYFAEYYMNNANVGLAFELFGEHANLNLTETVHDFEGMTIRQVLNRLIDRRRGVFWSVRVVDEVPKVLVGSMFGDDIELDAGPPAISIVKNPEQFEFAVDQNMDMRSVMVVLHRSQAYGTIAVLGERLEICASWSQAEGSLSEGWTSALETEYKMDPKSANQEDADLNDEARRSDRYRSVYQRYVIDATWDGTSADGTESAAEDRHNAFPWVDENGAIDTDSNATLSVNEGRLSRFLPINVEGSSEFLPPLVFAQDPDNAAHYVQVDAQSGDEERPAANVRILDDALGFEVRSKIPHIFGLNAFDTQEGDPLADAAVSNETPIYDPDELIATVAFQTEQRIQVSKNTNAYGPLTRKIDEVDVTRKMTIYIPGARMQYVVPDTSYKVEDGALVAHAGGLVRDDSEQLRRIAEMATAWYGKARASIKVSLTGAQALAEPGNYIRNIASKWHREDVGTIVTSITWRFSSRGNSTEIETGWHEIDAARILEFGDLGGPRAVAAAIKRLQHQTEKLSNIDDRRASTGGGGGATYDRAIYTGTT